MGWKNESYRHSLSSRGIPNTNTHKTYYPKLEPSFRTFGEESSKTIKVSEGRNDIGYMNITEHPTGSEEIPEPHLKVSMIEIDERFQGQGYGTELLHEAFQEQERSGLPLYLDANPPDKWSYINSGNIQEWEDKRDSLIAFYQRNGFVIHSENNDIITMVKK